MISLQVHNASKTGQSRRRKKRKKGGKKRKNGGKVGGIFFSWLYTRDPDLLLHLLSFHNLETYEQ